MAESLQSSRRPRAQRDLSNIPGFNHSRRSWTGNGVHITMETATYASPGSFFRSNTADGFSGFNDFLQPQSRRTRTATGGGGLFSGGFLGGAINLLNDAASAQTRRERPTKRVARDEYFTESEDEASDQTDSEDDLAYRSLPRTSAQQPNKSMFGKLKDRILDHGHHRGNRPREGQRPGNVRRDSQSDARSYRTQSPEAQRGNRRQPTVDYDETPESSPDRSTGPRPSTRDGMSERMEREVAALQRAVESERKQYLHAKHQFQQASQRNMIDPEHVQVLLDRVKTHGTLLASAQRNLQVAKEQQRRHTSTRQPQGRPQRRPSPPREPSYQLEDSDDDDYEPYPRQSFDPFSGSSRHGNLFEQSFRPSATFDPLGSFRVFDRLFADADTSFHGHGTGFQFFAGPGGTSFKRTNFGEPGTGPSRGPNRPRTFHDVPPQPQSAPRMAPQMPSNPLRAAEAAKLFATYNSTWNSLSATSPKIPYPTRTLLAPALADPSTIAHQSAHTWSTEQTMQANTALFFLLALGFSPLISDAGTVTFDRLAVDEASVKALLTVLKKEKMRWHSDRLGRRNEDIPGGGVNEELQRDERARAVFHGVCALMEFAME